MGSLTFFPTPYPGESVYSILSRYHQRSGNLHHMETIHQLFSANIISVCYYLTGPLHQDYIRKWIPQVNEGFGKDLRNSHSAYYFSELFGDDFYLTGPLEHRDNPFIMRMVSRYVFRSTCTSHNGTRLKYCPQCAAEQAAVYGEPYWEVLPQIRGVAICPRHMCPLLKSRVTFKSIHYSFITLAECIDPAHDEPVAVRPVAELRDAAITYANDVRYILSGRHKKHLENIRQKIYYYYWQHANIYPSSQDKSCFHKTDKVLSGLSSLDGMGGPGSVIKMSLPLMYRLILLEVTEGSLETYCKMLDTQQ